MLRFRLVKVTLDTKENISAAYYKCEMTVTFDDRSIGRTIDVLGVV